MKAVNIKMFAKKYCYFLFHAGDNLHRVVLCANQYATDHVNGGGCLILFVFILLHIAHLSTFSQYVYIGACAKFAHFAPCKAMPLIISKGRDCTALAPAPDWPTSISGMHNCTSG